MTTTRGHRVPIDSLTARATQLDGSSPLAHLRQRFLLPAGVHYLDGNSLGALPAGVGDRVADVVHRQWGGHLIAGWHGEDDWWSLPRRVGDRIGALIGAEPGETMAGDSTSVQFFNALTAAARLRPGRGVVVLDGEHFPTNRFIATSVATLLDHRVVQVPVGEIGTYLEEHGDDVAVVAYGAVDFRTGQRWDLPGVTADAHAAGALVVWDLSHAGGAMPLEIARHDVDFAVGCGYKYLSGGPGAPAYTSIRRRLHDSLDLPLTGWTGHARPFDMSERYEPGDGIERARVGSPPILALTALDAALDAFDGVDLADVRVGSLSLTAFFIDCVDDLLDDAVEVVTPRADEHRGSQVSLRHPDAATLMAELAAAGVVGDVRPPDILRFGMNALYVSHADVLAAAVALQRLRWAPDA